MNIFYLDRDPDVAARSLVDKHIRKMGIEAVQMLSCAYTLPEAAVPPPLTLAGEPYRGGYRNHPATRWTTASLDHWNWLAQHAGAIFNEYRWRFGTASRAETALAYMRERPPVWLPRGWSEPPQCMDDCYRQADAVGAYRQFYRVGKAHLHCWTGRPPPDWLAEGTVVPALLQK